MSDMDSMSTASTDSATDNDFGQLNNKLSSSWDMYFSRNDVENYDERLVYVATVSTIGEFWALYQHLKLPQFLRQGCDYMFFRSGIQPYWESKENKAGGRWMLEIPKAQRNTQLSDKWLETLLALVGEQLSKNSSEVNGAVVQSRRQQDRISVWTSTDDETAKRIGNRYQRCVQSTFGLKFQSHGNRTSSINLRYSFYVPKFNSQRTNSIEGKEKKNSSITGK